MKFRTELSPKQSHTQIAYKDKLLFLGSCFADNMATYFEQRRFDCTSNPFGTLYHPVAISNAIQIAFEDDYECNPIETNELWASFDTHSSLNRYSQEDFIQNFRLKQKVLKDQLHKAQHVFITLGTAHVYRHLELDKIVANCHKIPQKEFKKELMPLEEIQTALQQSFDRILQVNPTANIILTLSPVRYLRDGFEDNQLSKSLLYVGIKECVSNSKHVSYFPSYEYIIDDLRDYRFYDKDLVHPHPTALDYVWDKLKSTYFDSRTLEILKRVDKINGRLQHKIFNPNTTNAKAFVNATNQLKQALQNDFLDIDFGF